MYGHAFAAKADALAKLPAGLTSDQLLAAARNESAISGFSGYLADELKNITFPGERDAALKTLTAFEGYRQVGTQLRQMERAGDHKAAVALCTGIAPGQSEWAFSQFDDALGATLAINQSAFELAIARGFGALGNLEGISALLLAFSGTFIFLGFAARIKEYR